MWITNRLAHQSALASLLSVLLGSGTVIAEQKSREQRIADNEVYFSSGDEPPSMDISKQVDSVSSMWLGHIYEGLMRSNAAGAIIPGTAESVSISPDQTTWTFKIRPSAKWQDGVPVKAQDFVYSWRRLVDPAYASEYSFIAITASLLNADAIISKKLPKEQLGVRAVDDHTLEVKLSRPVAFFDSLTSFQVFYPLRQDIVEKFAGSFATDPASLIGNGPYRLARWQKEQSMRIEKSDTYWDARNIKIKAIESPAMVKDGQANFNNFRTGGIDTTGVSTPEIIRQAQAAKLKIETFQTGCTETLAFNVRPGRLFANKKLRHAVRAGLNRSEYVNKIVGVPGYKPAFRMVPDYMPGSQPGLTYRQEVKSPPIKDFDVPTTQRLVKEYLADTKQTQIPSFTLLFDDSVVAKKMAEYFQHSLSKLLGNEVKVETVPFKTRLQKSRDGQFDMVFFGWCPDYRDPMTFLDLLANNNENNSSGWSSPAYNKLIEQANSEVDKAKRVQLFKAAEDILEDEAPVAVTDVSGGALTAAPELKGVKRTIFGFAPDFRAAYWDHK